MLVSANYDDLKNAKLAIESLSVTDPSIYQMFLNIVELTRQLNYGFQYMGALLMDEDPSEFQPMDQDDYVLSIYHREIENLKDHKRFSDLKRFLKEYHQLSYANISKLAMGQNPKELAGPTVIH
ncbi:hypothetical protein [Neobacillus mesonae]|uniref:hypothetical protein n=1 Tax=Neobacillus mesonae TaxID=1193713 RepID=UPI002E235E62|nr:hypothetical protein [Neobacillus mesonae]